MQNKQSLLYILFALVSTPIFAQTTYIPLWAKENRFLERLEIKAGTNGELNLSTVKPYMRKAYVAVADSFRSMLLNGQNPARLTKIDQYDLNRFEANNKEYSKYDENSMPSWKNKKPLVKIFFPTKGSFLEVNVKDFYLVVNPVLNFQLGFESDYDKKLYINSKGAMFRGLIAKKVGFDFFLTDNQERGPLQYRDFLFNNDQAPGAAFWKTFKVDDADYRLDSNGRKRYIGATDYFDARGSVNVNVTKYINVQFGYDRNFIGNGYRSLYLSDFGASNLFLKLNTRIWKLNYTNLYMELVPNFASGSGDHLLDKKYASMHHLSLNVTKWLNVGLFESVIFGRPNSYDLSYLVPVIFLRSIEGNNGSPDNANVGIDLKANVAKKVQIYGQFLLDELNIKQLRKDKSWWGNKNALQVGVKYVDVAGIPNLDLQVEWNRIRPFTYTHRDTVSAYTNYNQPLAHPDGANLQEFIGIVRYRPMPKLFITAKAISYKQGLDSAGYNFGSNPNRLYNDGRLRDYGYDMFSGDPTTCFYGSLTASYELFENFFIDLNGTIRNYKRESVGTAVNTTVVSFGLRWNMFRREYDY